MAKGLSNAAPPPRPAALGQVEESAVRSDITPAEPAAPASAPRHSSERMFDQVRAGEMVQFNKRIPRAVADAFEMLAIRTHRRVPDLLAEAVELLQERHGRV